MSDPFSVHYRRACEALEAEASAILERPLTPHERSAIWECGTLPWLEMRIEMPMLQNPAALADILASVADDLQDGRLEELQDGLAGMLAAMLERRLHEEELIQVRKIPTALAIMELGEALANAAPDERESLLRVLLAAV